MKFIWALGVMWLVLGCATAQEQSTVVLPFFNESKTPNLDWVGESVSETIREALGMQGIIALDRDERQQGFRRLGLRLDANPTRATIYKIGQALDAGHIVYGQFELIPPPAGVANTKGSLRITARVLDLKRTIQGPEFTEVGALEDLAAEQTHLAWQVIQSLSPNTAPTEAAFRQQYPQVRVDAIESYIRGLLASSHDQKYKLFLQAVRLEPKFSDAAYQLGMLAYTKEDYRSAGDWFQKVAAADIHYAQAGFYLGICRFHASDYPAAQAAFERVAETVPLNEVYNNLGAAQSRRNLPGALDSFRKALEGDTGDPLYHFNVGYALWKQNRFAEAADSFRAVLERDPEDQEATLMLGRCLKGSGAKQPEAKPEVLERLKTNYEESAYRQLKALLQTKKP